MPRYNMSHMRRFFVKHIEVREVSWQERGVTLTMPLWMWKGSMKNPGFKWKRDGAFSVNGHTYTARRWLYAQLYPKHLYPLYYTDKYLSGPLAFDDRFMIVHSKLPPGIRERYEKKYKEEFTCDLHPDHLRRSTKTPPHVRTNPTNRMVEQQVNPRQRNRNKNPLFQSDLHDSRTRLTAKQTAALKEHRRNWNQGNHIEKFLEDRHEKGVRPIELEYPQVTERLELCRLFIDGHTDEEVMELIRKGKLK